MQTPSKSNRSRLLAAFPGPIVMTVLLTRVSGKDLLEKSMAERPGYREYVERTSGFIPWPPRGSG